MFRFRYRKILWFFARVLLGVIWWEVVLVRLGLGSLARRTRTRRYRQIAVDFRALAIQLGGVMIKMGQFLSARVDVLPREITDELSGLQDEVGAEPYQNICAVVEAEFGCRLEDKFSEFEVEPLASASIGQVHRARLRVPSTESGEVSQSPQVVVKVQRPNIRQIVDVDLSALQVVSRWVNLYEPVRRRANVPMLLNEFQHTLYEEIDYLNEGKNAETFAENFKDQLDVSVPKVYWSHTTRCVLTLQDVMSIKITDYEAMDAAKIDRAEVANRLLDIYLKQIFEDRFFHADPHPGNLFVCPGELREDGKAAWKLVFVDFGMVGTISPQVYDGLRELFIAVSTQDGRRVIKGYQMLGILLPGADVDMLERAAMKVFERFWGKTTTQMMEMKNREAQEFISEFGELMYEMPFQIPQNFILLGRAVGILSGICTGLYTDFNVFTVLSPYARKLAGEVGGLDFWLKEAANHLTLLFTLPKRADALLQRAERGDLEVRTPELKQQFVRLERSQRRMTAAVVFAVLFMGGVQLYLAGGHTLAAAFCGAGALLALLWMAFLR